MRTGAGRLQAILLPSLIALALTGKAGERAQERSGSAAGNDSGRALFVGAAPLHGRLYTHSADLPAAVVRCANCHASASSPAAAMPQSNAPRLDRDWLTVARPRRGAPRSAYDERSFCAVLRTGIDPQQIVINVEMPRYALADSQCGALWQFLTRAGDG